MDHEVLPFTPEILDALPEELAELYRNLENTLLEEICSRLKVSGELNEVTVLDIQALRSHGISQQEIEQAIKRTTNIGEKELNKLFDDVVERNQKYYTYLINRSDVTAPKTMLSASDFDAIKKQTLDTFRNLTQSMAFCSTMAERCSGLQVLTNGHLIMPCCRYRVEQSVTIRLLKVP